MTHDIQVFPVRKKLPVPYNTEIGRIITRWALAEFALHEVAYMLLGLGPKEGRVAVREPRAGDYLTMILDLMSIKGFNTSLNVKTLRTLLSECETMRNKLAHGIWLHHSETKVPVIQEVKGKYPTEPGGKSVKARIDPKSMVMELKVLRQITKNIEYCIVQIYRLKHQITSQQQARGEESS